MLTTDWSFALFCSLLAMVATLTTWIGKTPDINGGLWLKAGGLTNFSCIAWKIVGRKATPHVEPDISRPPCFFGLSIIGLGFSSRKHPSTRESAVQLSNDVALARKAVNPSQETL
ncbi:hypothetical protein [Agrobacterium sp. SORGH_AS 787]|uniref:hypothetical protein n=1 Tax=Agrobacterium sp. SORGH_AS 787 TaxID=3041775 RepID=UPI0032B7DC62